MVGFPLLLIPLAIYNIIVFLMPGVSMTEPLFRVTLMSGAERPVTLSDILLALGIILLLLEVVKGARPGAKFVMDHLLSLVVFGAAAAEFLLLPKFASSTFFLLTLLALVDFLSGIAQRTRRSRHYAPAPVPSRRAEAPAAEPHFEPAPAPRAPSPVPAPQPAPPVAAHPPPSASAIESVSAEHKEPAPAQPGTSAEPQSSGGTPTSPDEGHER